MIFRQICSHPYRVINVIPFIKKYGEKRDCLLLSYPHEVLYAYLEMAYEMCPMIVVEHLNVDIRTYTYNIDMHVHIYI